MVWRGRGNFRLCAMLPKVGRNEMSPCGAEEKHKRCCGGATVN
jgi:uncharacterized protein YchJ